MELSADDRIIPKSAYIEPGEQQANAVRKYARLKTKTGQSHR